MLICLMLNHQLLSTNTLICRVKG